jgi:signal recognition particle subunit SRP54
MGKGGMLKQAMKGMFGKNDMPDMNDPAAMEEAAKKMGANLPGGMGGMPGLGGGMGLPPGLSGFGKKK